MQLFIIIIVIVILLLLLFRVQAFGLPLFVNMNAAAVALRNGFDVGACAIIFVECCRLCNRIIAFGNISTFNLTYKIRTRHKMQICPLDDVEIKW